MYIMNKRGIGIVSTLVIAVVALIVGGLIGDNLLGSTRNFAFFSSKGSSSSGSANLGGGFCDTCDTCLGDFSGNNDVGSEDLAQLLGNWGPCGAGVTCSTDADCPPDQASGYCSGSSVCTITNDYTCTNPGTTQSACINSTSVSCTPCANGCSNGQCNPPPVNQTYLLTVTKTGSTGSGTVTSNPVGINCGTDCTQSYNSGTSVTLTATPSGGSSFAGWTGSGCSGVGTCIVLMNANKNVNAQFDLNNQTNQTNQTGPDLIVTDIWFIAQSNQTNGTTNVTNVTFAAGIKNVGNVIADADGLMRHRFLVAPQNLIANVFTGDIFPGQTVTVSMAFALNPIQLNTVTVTADFDNEIPETNENNNQLSEQFLI